MNVKVALTLVAVTVAAVLLQTIYAFTYYRSIMEDLTDGYTSRKLRNFNSYRELEEYVKTKRSIEAIFYTLRGGALLEAFASKTSTPAAEYSTTNVQVEGVDEADIVKTDGRYIYAISRGGVVIIRAYPPKEAVVEARIRTNGSPQGLFIAPGKLIVISSNARFVERVVNDSKEADVYVRSKVSGIYSIVWEEAVTEVTIYDLSNLNVLSNFKIDGSYISSRMIGSYVYVFTSQQVYRLSDEVVIPGFELDGICIQIDPRDISYVEDSMGPYSYTNILAVDVDSGEYIVKSLLVGYAGAVYVSRENIYLATPRWGEEASSSIYRIAMDGLKLEAKASTEVPGIVLNQFSMDEYNGYFRVATSTQGFVRILTRSNTGEIELSTNIYVARVEDMSIIGRLEGLAPGENMYSARFVGERCYLVTFKKVDPLFVIDLSDPYNPRVLGYLKIPGYSDYLHPYGGGYLIGIGKETVEAEEGDFAWYQGVKISLFDVRDVSSPVEIGKYVIGDRGTDTPVLRDHKALLVDYRNNLVILPILEAKIDLDLYGGDNPPPYAYGEPVWQGVYVLRISDAGIEYVGRITHIDNVKPNGKMEEKLWMYSELFINRAIYIDDILYTISDGRIKMNSLSGLSEIAILDI
ncbi:MAG: beta-propeller domain-containing protein [Nitrososphaerota archaeon]|nr:beta-propeller domain-containing protein [Nitrososphaerota archaeon]